MRAARVYLSLSRQSVVCVCVCVVCDVSCVCDVCSISMCPAVLESECLTHVDVTKERYPKLDSSANIQESWNFNFADFVLDKCFRSNVTVVICFTC